MLKTDRRTCFGTLSAATCPHPSPQLPLLFSFSCILYASSLPYPSPAAAGCTRTTELVPHTPAPAHAHAATHTCSPSAAAAIGGFVVWYGCDGFSYLSPFSSSHSFHTPLVCLPVPVPTLPVFSLLHTPYAASVYLLCILCAALSCV